MKSSKVPFFALLALMFISLVLRPPVAAIGPLVPNLIATEGLSLLQIGILTSASVVCFGLGAFAGPSLVKHFGLHKSMLFVLLLLTGAMATRLIGGYILLVVCTVLIGLSIAIANVLIPTVVREQFPKKIELITGVYVTLLAISASLAATIAVPVAGFFGSWRGALGIWLIPAVLGILFWLPIVRTKEIEVVVTAETHAQERSAVLRSPLTWAIVAFFGLQSLGFYSILNWLPKLLVDRGMSESGAGGLLGLATFVGVPTGFLISIFIRRFKTLSYISVFVTLLSLTGFTLLLVNHDLVLVACLIAGFGFAATFPLSLTLISSRASTATQTTQLSALAQGWGYLIAATGTFLFGFLKDYTGGWESSLYMLIGLTALQLVAGYLAGKDRHIPAE